MANARQASINPAHPWVPRYLIARAGMSPPFFVVCSGRSGSTLLAGMLNMHPAIHVPVELGGLYSALPRRLPRYGDLSKAFNRRLLAAALARTGHLNEFKDTFSFRRFDELLQQETGDLRAVLGSFYETLRESSGKRHIGDKTPDHIPYFDRVVQTFPEAQIIHLVRDGRDCALSSMAWRQGINFRNIWELGVGWSVHNLTVAAHGRCKPECYLRIRYEDLIDDPETSLRRITEFLGERYDSRMLDYRSGDFVRQNVARLSHHANLARDILSDNRGKWMRSMPAREARVFESLAGEALQEFGYPLLAQPLSSGDRFARGSWHLATLVRQFRRRVRGARLELRFLVATRVKRSLGVLHLDEVPAAVLNYLR